MERHIPLGISHPCSQFDRWRVIFGPGADGTVRPVLHTRFG